MAGKTTNADVEDVKKVISFVLETPDEERNAIFPWHIARAINNRIEKSDDSKITVNNSHIRMIVSGILRMYDEDNIDEDVRLSIRRLHGQISEDEE